MEAEIQLQGWAFVEALYESSVQNCGAPLELRMFDPKLSDGLNEEWLANAVEQYGITESEMRGMIADGLLRKWPGPSGGKNFIIYSEKQAEAIKRWLMNPRYSRAEVLHIVDEWNTFLEQIIMQEPAYDDMDVSEYEHFRRRTQEMVEALELKVEYSDSEGNPLHHERLVYMRREDR